MVLVRVCEICKNVGFYILMELKKRELFNLNWEK